MHAKAAGAGAVHEEGDGAGGIGGGAGAGAGAGIRTTSKGAAQMAALQRLNARMHGSPTVDNAPQAAAAQSASGSSGSSGSSGNGGSSSSKGSVRSIMKGSGATAAAREKARERASFSETFPKVRLCL